MPIPPPPKNKHRRGKSDILLSQYSNNDHNHVKVENLNFDIITRKHSILKFWNSDLTSKRLLNNVHCEFPRNKLSCIVGPSGAGKTTLLNMKVMIERLYLDLSVCVLQNQIRI